MGRTIWEMCSRFTRHQKMKYKPKKKNFTIPKLLQGNGCVINFINYYFAIYIHIGILAIIAVLTFGEPAIRLLENVTPIQEFLLSYIFYFSYYTLFESLFGRRIGKFITGTRVVDYAGGKPTYRQIMWCSLSRLIPFEPFSFFSSNGDGWHDSIPSTLVIKT